MKNFIFIFILLSPFISSAKKPPEKYFLMNDGTKQVFMKFDHFAKDTLYFSKNLSIHYILVDSIKEVHINQHSHALGLGIGGFFVGGFIGLIVGAALGEGHGEFSGFAGAVGGLLIGSVAGTVLGIVAGETNEKKIDLDLGKYNTEERINILKIVLKGL